MSFFDDLLSGQSGAVSPWGVLYQSSPVTDDSKDATKRFAQALATAGDTGTAPGLPQILPFGPVPDLRRPAPAPHVSSFATGTAPFSFAGPGSMQVDPSMLASAFGAGAKPVPYAAGPVTAQPQAGPATNLSSVNRPPAAPGASAPNYYVPIGKQADGSIYNMPLFGEAPTASGATAAAGATAPFAFGAISGGLADRLAKATTGFIGNLHNGPVGALAGGLGALVTGRNTDPSSIDAEKMNTTATALLGKGVPLADVQAAKNNPALLNALISQYYGRDKWKLQKTGRDGSGRETYSWVNEADATSKPFQGGFAGGAMAAGANAVGNYPRKV
jgi:hypothetical protein